MSLSPVISIADIDAAYRLDVSDSDACFAMDLNDVRYHRSGCSIIDAEEKSIFFLSKRREEEMNDRCLAATANQSFGIRKPNRVYKRTFDRLGNLSDKPRRRH